jgi:hypothetical protein
MVRESYVVLGLIASIEHIYPCAEVHLFAPGTEFVKTRCDIIPAEHLHS